MFKRACFVQYCLIPLVIVWSPVLYAQSPEPDSTDTTWKYGIKAAVGIFNFRNSLFARTDPDPPGNLSDDWAEFFIKPWASFSHDSGTGTWFGAFSWAYARTGDDTSVISGGDASSTDFDDLYLGWRYGSPPSGQFEVAGGRYPYQNAHGFLIADGYADGGGRGALWSNPRTAWETTLYYRYAFFEGDNPDTLTNENFDPLFPAFYDWGSWWQGEIAGEYFLANSNLITNMLRLHSKPRGKSTGTWIGNSASYSL